MKSLYDIEEEIKPRVELFVTNLNGRFKEFISDRALTALFMTKMCEKSEHTNDARTRGEAIYLEYPGDAYDIGCFVFEVFLENGCGAKVNGHHAAQDFEKEIMKKQVTT